MRKVLFVVLLAGLVVACKKSRTCNCTITRSGVVTISSRSTGLSLPAIPGFPVLPGIGGGSDTLSEPYNIITTEISEYDKVSKSNMRANCPKLSEELIFDRQTNMAAGTYTSITVDSGKKVTECTIE